MLGLRTGTVKVCTYCKEWESQFSAEKQRLSRSFGLARHRIEHIGSTAVPGLDAKPIIDLAVQIPSFRQLDTWTARLQHAGYDYKGEYGLPGRHFFTRGTPVAYHLHLVRRGCAHWADWILFRDYLRASPREAERYRTFKLELARRYAHDRNAYTKAKTPFVARMMARARRWLDGEDGTAPHG